MRKINWVRLLLAGLVAGVVGDVLGFLVDGVMLQQDWADDMLTLGRNEFSNKQIMGFEVLGLIFGILSIVIYVGFRSRFGAGWKTAIYAGVVAWAIGVALPNFTFMAVIHLFSNQLTLYTTLCALVEVVAGTVAGAFLYKD